MGLGDRARTVTRSHDAPLTTPVPQSPAGGDIEEQCKPVFNPKCSQRDVLYWQLYRNDTIANLEPVYRSDRDGLFLSACCMHCSSQTQLHNNTWTGLVIDGFTPADSLHSWLTGGAGAEGAKRRDPGVYGSNPTCLGFSSERQSVWAWPGKP